MAFVSGRCPNCGGEVKLDDSMEKGFCLRCGSPIVVQSAVAKFKVEHSGSVKLSGVATDQSLVEYGYSILKLDPVNAKKEFENALRINPHNWQAWKALSESLIQFYSKLPKNYIEFMNRDIVENDFSQPFTHKTLESPICIRNSGGYYYAFCGAYVLGYPASLSTEGGHKQRLSGNSFECKLSFDKQNEIYFVPLENVLSSAIRNTPDIEKEKLITMKNRFVDYSINKCRLCVEVTARMSNYQCLFCGNKLGLSKKRCGACGKQQAKY